ncbi:hypothetical protein ACFVYP_37565 [Kitasatospora sp. NPDC058201]|uniref:hypothetical protein n=1 Tax=unclassified Kitasatospora TaxID=2633591 RepID=UPI0036560B2A
MGPLSCGGPTSTPSVHDHERLTVTIGIQPRNGIPHSPSVFGTPCPRCNDHLILDRTGQQTLEMIAGGMADDEITERNGWSPGQVQWHVRGILERLESRSRVQAVDIGYRAGLLPPLSNPPSLNRPLDPLEFYAFVSSTRGNPRRVTTRLLGVGTEAVKSALQRVHKRLGLTDGKRYGPRAVYLLHSAKLLPDSHPCLCQPLEPLPSPGELARLRREFDAALIGGQGTPCPRCGVQVKLNMTDYRALVLMARGLRNPEIAEILKTGSRFVAFRIKRLRKVLEVAARRPINRAGAVDFGWRAGILPVPANLPAPPPVIEDRALTAMRLIAQGSTTLQAAEAIGVVQETVARALRRTYEQVGVTGFCQSVEAVYRLHGLGVLPDGHPCGCTPSPGAAPTAAT